MTNQSDDSELPTISGASSDKAGVPVGAVPQIEGYEISDRLGEGGMGTVWRAIQLSTRREVALKLLLAARIGSEKARLLFEREVELAARLEHPNIARVYDSGLHHGVYYYAMELIDGVHLDEYVEKNALTQRQILDLMKVIAQAVQHAHQRGVIHRDLKPSNILVTEDGQPYVLDFGLAKAFLEGERDATVSIAGDRAGTPAYMSPEQAAGQADQIDTRSDVYSLGVILYRLMTGQFPHDVSGTQWDVYRRIAEEEVRRPREVTKEVDGELEALLLKALARNPESRYTSAGDLATDIRNYLSGDPLTARKPTTAYFLRKRIRKYRVPVTAGGLVLLALIGMAVFAYVRVTLERNRADSERAKAELAERRSTEQRDAAEQARKLAENQRQLAERQAEAHRRALYFNRIALAGVAHRTGNLPRARELLTLCPEDLRRWEWNRLWHISTPFYTTIRYYGANNAVSFSPDGKWVASGNEKGTVVIWDVQSGSEVIILRGHGGRVTAVSFTPDGKRVVSAGTDKTIRIWDANTGSEIMTLAAQTAGSLSISPDGKHLLTTCWWSRKIAVWDAQSGIETMSLHAPKGIDAVASFDPSGRYIVGGTRDDPTVRVWNATTGKEVMRLIGHDRSVLSASFSPDGKRIVSGGGSGITVWDAINGQKVMAIAFDGHGHGYNAAMPVLFSPNGKFIVSGWGYTVKILNANSGKELTTLRLPNPGGIQSISVSPDSKYVATGTRCGTLMIWDIAKGTLHKTCRGYRGSNWTLALTRGGNRVIVGDYKGVVKVWDLDGTTGSMRLVTTVRGYGGMPTCDGNRILAFDDNGMIRVWDVVSGLEVTKVPRRDDKVTCASASPDGSRIVFGDSDGKIGIWDVGTNSTACTLPGHKEAVTGVTFSPSGRFIASAGEDGSIKVWNANRGVEILTLTGHQGLVRSVAFSPGEEHIVSGGMDKTIRVWDAASGLEVVTLSGFQYPVSAVAFGHDGAHVVVGSMRRVSEQNESTVRIWDGAACAEVITIHGHGTTYVVGAFSPDGKRIASANYTLRGVRLWDAETGAHLTSLHGHSLAWAKRVHFVAFSRDGKRVLSVGEGNGRQQKTLKIWDIASGVEVMSVDGIGPRGESGVGLADVSTSGDRIVVSDTVFRLSDAAKISTFSDPDIRYSIGSVAFSPDGRLVASGNRRGEQVRIWDSANGVEVRSFAIHFNVSCLRFSSDGDKLVLGGRKDGAIVILDSVTGKTLTVLRGHRERVLSLALNPKGDRIVSGGEDGLVKIWNTKSGSEIMTLSGALSRITSVAFSPDGRRILATTFNGTIKIWDAPNAQNLSEQRMAAIRLQGGDQRRHRGAPQKTKVSSESPGKGRSREDLRRAIGMLIGKDGKIDREKAKRLLLMLAEKGDPLARMWVARCRWLGFHGFRKDREWAKKIAGQVIAEIKRMAVEDGDTEAAFLLGSAYQEGLGLDKDAASAIRYYAKAAENGDVFAMTNLGCIYDRGWGVAQDHAKAFRWFRRAAEAGEPVAMSKLGWMYLHGEGVEQHKDESVRWFRRSAALGDANAMNNLGWMYEGGRGVPKDYAKSLEWYRKAVSEGYPLAMTNLALMYEAGRGVDKDFGRALHWYRRAADAGSTQAMNALGRFYLEKSYRPDTREAAEAMGWYRRAAWLGDSKAKTKLRELGKEW